MAVTIDNDANGPPPQWAATNRRLRFLIRDAATDKDLVAPIEVLVPTMLPLKIAKLYLPTVAFKAIKERLTDALKAAGFK